MHNHFEESAEYGQYTLPRAARTLVNAATACQWKAGWRWQEDNSGAPFVTVIVGDAGTGEKFQYTWHSRGCKGTGMRLFSRGFHTMISGYQADYGPSLTDAVRYIQGTPASAC